MKITKKPNARDYMLRSRLNSIEKMQLELLIKYYEVSKNIKLTKVDIFRHLLSKEFDAIQMDIVNSLEPLQ